MKLLDREAFNYTTQRIREEGASQRKIATELSELGYTNPSGRKIDQSDLSKFMVKNGYRMKTNQKRPKKTITKIANQEHFTLPGISEEEAHADSEPKINIIKMVIGLEATAKDKLQIIRSLLT